MADQAGAVAVRQSCQGGDRTAARVLAVAVAVRAGSAVDAPATAVQGHVIGEHDDGAVVCASSTTVNGAPAAVPLAEVRAELRTDPGRISAGVG
ncbi:hypothetical protein WB401_36365 [Streptomyces brasiliscabiei]|uniref:Uncharacterized protein n=1 Tax=Streptomyces brasiliscabiei TaxID=2736302 RepID=A0ABU8GQN1_9ACTN